MKNIFLILLVIITFSGYGQNNDVLTYSEVVKVDSTFTQNNLFESARSWFNTSFNSSKDVIQIIDKESGQISGKGLMKFNPNCFFSSALVAGIIRFDVNVYIKDGRYKYEFTNFIHEGSYASGNSPISLGLITTSAEYPHKKPAFNNGQIWYNKNWNDIKARISEVIPSLINSLKEAMNENVKNDW